MSVYQILLATLSENIFNISSSEQRGVLTAGTITRFGVEKSFGLHVLSLSLDRR